MTGIDTEHMIQEAEGQKKILETGNSLQVHYVFKLNLALAFLHQTTSQYQHREASTSDHAEKYAALIIQIRKMYFLIRKKLQRGKRDKKRWKKIKHM